MSQNKTIRAIERQRQCRSRRPAHFSEHPEVDAKIDAYVKENPKYWSYVQPCRANASNARSS